MDSDAASVNGANGAKGTSPRSTKCEDQRWLRSLIRAQVLADAGEGGRGWKFWQDRILEDAYWRRQAEANALKASGEGIPGAV